MWTPILAILPLMLHFNLQKSVEKLHMSESQSVSAVLNAEPQLDWFWTFFHFLFVSFLEGTTKKIMTTCKIILTPTNGWFHVKSPRKTWPIFFGFLTWKVKSISYFSNKNTFLDIFWWILTIFWFFKEISNFVKLDVVFHFFFPY